MIFCFFGQFYTVMLLSVLAYVLWLLSHIPPTLLTVIGSEAKVNVCLLCRNSDLLRSTSGYRVVVLPRRVPILGDTVPISC